MFAASQSHRERPVSVLLGGSGIRRLIEARMPDVAALLKPRIGRYVSQSMPVDAIVPLGEVVFLDLGCKRTCVIDTVMATDDPELVLEQM